MNKSLSVLAACFFIGCQGPEAAKALPTDASGGRGARSAATEATAAAGKFVPVGIPYFSLNPPGEPILSYLWLSSHGVKANEAQELRDAESYWNGNTEFFSASASATQSTFTSPKLDKWIPEDRLSRVTFVSVTFKAKAIVYADHKENAGGTITIVIPRQDGDGHDAVAWAGVTATPDYPGGFTASEDIKNVRVLIPVSADGTFKWRVFVQLSTGQPVYLSAACWLSGYYLTE